MGIASEEVRPIFSVLPPEVAYPYMQNAAARTREDSDAVIQQHDSRIRHLARRFVGSGASVDDLMQEGRLALFLAAKLWRPDGGACLWTYARRAVFAAMLRHASAHISESHIELTENVATDEALETSYLIRECLEMLGEEEREVIRLWMSGETFEAIGAALGKSDWYARNVLGSAVNTLRERVS